MSAVTHQPPHPARPQTLLVWELRQTLALQPCRWVRPDERSRRVGDPSANRGVTEGDGVAVTVSDGGMHPI